jgi:hypothetical protein
MPSCRMQADRDNQLVRRIDIFFGTVTTLAGVALSSGLTDGVGMGARFNQPYGVVMNAAGAVAIVVSTTTG